MNIADFTIAWGNIVHPLLPPFSSQNLGVTFLIIHHVQVLTQPFTPVFRNLISASIRIKVF